MPIKTNTYDLEAERDRLAGDMDEYAEMQAENPVGSGAAQQAARLGQQAQQYKSGIDWALAEWGVSAVTLSALSHGERTRVLDTVERNDWPHTDCYVAAGTYDAPYLEHDPEAVTQDAFEETALNVADLHPAFVDWVEARITDLSRVGDDTGKSYETLVLEKRIQAASRNESG